MSKTVTSFEGKLITIETPLSFDEVASRFEVETSKAASSQVVIPFQSAPSSKEDMIREFDKVTNYSKGFRYFFQFSHHLWMRLFDPDTPRSIVYNIGNPLVAESILKHDLRAAFNIPPRVLVLEKADGSGTSVVYHLPSSVMAMVVKPELKAAAEALDNKLEKMLMKVVSVDG